ncbi:MAG: HAMP domain-containing histidine kinase [Clostridiales Family XIII bacterium]|jgi:two-component system sensor kinase Ihk|nr:HAMP domain-containing histidine kinase [Clostridiales Family XIII bacterium]
MRKGKGKTVALIAMLITAIMLFSCAVIYFALPPLYLYSKNAAMSSNIEKLAQKLAVSQDSAYCKTLIEDFSSANNAIIISYDKDGEVINELSSIFIAGGGTVQISASSGTRSIIVTSRADPDVRGQAILEKAEAGNGQSIPDEAWSLRSQSVPDEAGPVRGQSIPDEAGLVRGQTSNMRALYFERSDSTLLVEKSIRGDLIDKITISSTFQPINEAKHVILILFPFLLIIDILFGVILAHFYLKKAEENAQNKVDFMRASHHELKTPVAALSGIVDGMIDNVGVYKDRDVYLREAKHIIGRLSALTHDVLNATQSDNRKIRKEKIDLRALLDEILSDYPGLTCNGFEFACNADRGMLKNAISNVISNAVRHTTGNVEISFANRTLFVKNDCESIPFDNLFEPFYTLSASRDKSASGNGLGLYIVKRNLDRLRIKFDLRNTETGVVFKIFF